MKRTILLVVHQENSDPGRVASALAGLGCRLDLRRLAVGDRLPEDLDPFDGAVVFGGPMSANDDHLPFIRAELEWIPKWVATGKPYLGICLGAQLLARSHGAQVGPHARGYHEIGYYRLDPTPAGRQLFEPGMHAYQWHGEGFDLPGGATLLARGEHFPNQAFRLGDNAYGIQFHPEVTVAIMRFWSAHASHRLVLPGAQSRQEQHARAEKYDNIVDRWTPVFLRRWLSGVAHLPDALAWTPDLALEPAGS